ncbi:MAG: hypothetical protein HWE22_11525 [Flavobacteriales bacterium]|nr:hypothetical protein [Flavobacteriales bacterium]
MFRTFRENWDQADLLLFVLQSKVVFFAIVRSLGIQDLDDAKVKDVRSYIRIQLLGTDQKRV